MALHGVHWVQGGLAVTDFQFSGHYSCSHLLLEPQRYNKVTFPCQVYHVKQRKTTTIITTTNTNSNMLSILFFSAEVRILVH